MGRLEAGNAGAPFEAPPSFFMHMSLEPLDIDAIRRARAGSDFGSDLRYVEETDSTNTLAAALPPGTWRSGTTLFTDYQRAGRGRNGRTWLAPPRSSLLLSVVLSPPPGIQLSDFVALSALSVADAVAAVTELRPRIKWPNDVHIAGRKLAGILLEHRQSPENQRLIIGMGINANVPVESLRPLGAAATSLQVETGEEVSRTDLAIALLDSLDMWYRCFTLEPDAVFGAWRSRLDTLGAELEVHDNAGVWSGRAIELQRDGGLIVERDDRERRIVHAADVSLRPRSGLQLP